MAASQRKIEIELKYKEGVGTSRFLISGFFNLAMTKPIVATNIDGITEQITDGVNGILVPPKDPSALAKAVIRVLNDKKLARSIGLAARKKVEQEFSVEKMVRETERVYLSLLEKNIIDIFKTFSIKPLVKN